MGILIKYWKYWVPALLLAAIIGGEWLYGKQRYQAGYKAAEAAMQQRLAEQRQKHAKQGREASAEYQQTKAEAEAKVRVQREVVQKIIERPVYSSDCVDADGLRELNAAIAGRR